MKDETKFWNKIAKKYAAKPVPNQAIYEKKLRLTQDYLQATMEVLEIGCGTGTTALIQAKFVKHIKAIDFSEKMIAIAREKAAAQKVENVTFVCEDINQLDEPAAYYDIVMGHSILHLLPDRERMLKTVFEILKPGGIFITSTVCIADFFRLFAVIFPVGHRLGIFPLVKAFSSKMLIQEHQAAGFLIEYQWQPNKKNLFLIAKKPE